MLDISNCYNLQSTDGSPDNIAVFYNMSNQCFIKMKEHFLIHMFEGSFDQTDNRIRFVNNLCNVFFN